MNGTAIRVALHAKYLHIGVCLHLSLVQLLHGFVGTFFGHEFDKTVPAVSRIKWQIAGETFALHRVCLHVSVLPSVLACAARLFDQRAGMYLHSIDL